MSDTTTAQYDPIITKSREIFLKKTKDYGTAWRVLRPSSLTDQLMIKAKRIRTIQEKGEHKVQEGVSPEFYALINYSIMALIQLKKAASEEADIAVEEAAGLYDELIAEARRLMLDKNHDYGEAWRDMRISSITDMIMMKLLRVRQIEENKGRTIASEGIDANYFDIINYAIFALIKLEEQEA